MSLPPHELGFFKPGEFVFIPGCDWRTVRAGMVVERCGEWLVWFPPVDPRDKATETPLDKFTEPLARDILIDYSGIGSPRGPKIDPLPWLAISDALFNRLRDADSRRLRLEVLMDELKSDAKLDADLVEDTMRMFAGMGRGKVWMDAGGLWFGLSKLAVDGLARKDYLSSFSDELLAKSRRIDSLIRHTSTVGSYREELVRSLVRQLVPSRYHVSMGFIESSPRQLDVIVWDAGGYAPLFREQDFVVVPAASVRAIIEVKTTLNTDSLDEALEILYDVNRVEQPLLPIFKGIFAFESNYVTDQAVADRMYTFFNGFEKNGIVECRHRYLEQGISAVCVPNRNFVYQRYRVPDDPNSFPYPVLNTLEPEGRGDIRAGVFLGELLSHLDMESEAKRTQLGMFLPIYNECRTRIVNELFGPSWTPNMATSRLSATLNVSGAREYVSRVAKFRSGLTEGRDVSLGLDTESAIQNATMEKPSRSIRRVKIAASHARRSRTS
ncbi:DUF6602 domain-containing protein [Paraburkholderia dilworthii]|uniref:DUF6602 domain-containing protein n=1 Tax=Paraburkholderia dilworthii TaxID=948106 RepID=A0ABW9DER6_9BURK